MDRYLKKRVRYQDLDVLQKRKADELAAEAEIEVMDVRWDVVSSSDLFMLERVDIAKKKPDVVMWVALALVAIAVIAKASGLVETVH